MVRKERLRIGLLVLWLFMLHVVYAGSGYGALFSRSLNPALDDFFEVPDSLKSYLNFDAANKKYDSLIIAHPNSDISTYALLSKIDNCLMIKKTKQASQLLRELNENQIKDIFKADATYLDAILFYQLGKVDESYTSYRVVQEIIEHQNVNALTLGAYYINCGELMLYAFEDVAKAKDYFDKAFYCWQQQLDRNHFLLGKLYYSESVIHQRRNEYIVQREYASKTMSIADIYQSTYPRLKFSAYSLLTDASTNFQEFDKSYEIVLEQLEFAERFKIPDYLRIYSYNALAECEKLRENYEKSIKFDQKILNSLKKTSNNDLFYSLVLRRMAYCSSKIGKFSKAKDLYKDALSLNLQSPRRKAQVLRYFAEFLFQEKHFEEARVYNEDAINIYQTGWESNQNKSYILGLIICWKQKGDILNRLGYANKEALEAYQNAAKYVEQYKDVFYFDETELTLSNFFRPLYESILELSINLYQTSKDSIYLNHIYNAIESNKYQTLWKKLKDKDLYRSEEIPDSLAGEIKNLEEQISIYNQRYLKGDLDTDDFIQLNRLKEQFAALTHDKFAFKLSTNTINLNDFQTSLNENETALLLFEGIDICYGLAVTIDSVAVIQINLNETYLNAFQKLQVILNGEELELNEDIQIERFLKSNKIVSAPFNSIVNQYSDNRVLTIIPDGIFSYLPFDALLMGGNQGSDFKSLNYYIDNYSINYHISTKLLIDKADEDKKLQNSNKIIAFGPTEASYLFQAIEEVNQIKKMYGKKCEMHIENQRNAFLNNDQNFDLVHISAHAVIDSNNHNLSYIHFGDIEDDSLKVFDYEISNHDFKDALVVLNACETFKGEHFKGEGIYSLSQSFIIAGASSIISTLWKIEDKSAANLMGHFYKKVNQGRTFANGLKEAKIALKLDAKTAHPYFWASYIYNGDVQIQKQKAGFLWPALILSFLLLLVVGTIWQKY